jgi:hypothetical protein
VRAQELRLDSQLLEARALLRACAEPSCPNLVRSDCAVLLAEIQRALPTVVLELSNPELNPTKVSITVNGRLQPVAFGETYEFDAGALALRIEAPGYQPLEETLIVREGEKNRVVQIRLLLPAPPALPVMLPPLGNPPRTPTVTADAAKPRALEVAPYVLAGVALVATATSAYFVWSALDRRDRLQRSCAPLCSENDQERVGNDLLIADIAGGVALGAGAVSITLFVLDSSAATDRTVRKPRLAIDGVASAIGGTLW